MMDKKTIKEFLRPDLKKILIFGVFIFILIAAYIQSWAFSDVPPKPPLYDLLSPFPFWITWMFLVMPLVILNLPFNYALAPYFYPLQIVYFYLLSCAAVSAYNYRSKINKRYFVMALIPLLILVFFWFGVGPFIFGPASTEYISLPGIFMLGLQLIPVFFIGAFYFYLLFCLVTFVRDKIKNRDVESDKIDKKILLGIGILILVLIIGLFIWNSVIQKELEEPENPPIGEKILKACTNDSDCIVVESIRGFDYVPTSDETCGCLCVTSINPKYEEYWMGMLDNLDHDQRDKWRGECDKVCKPCALTKENSNAECLNNQCVVVHEE